MLGLLGVLLGLLVFGGVESAKYLPSEFVWGTASSAYQIEGSWDVDGREESIWDVFSHEGKCRNNDTGDIADDHYARLVEDIQLINRTQLPFYRFSLSWSRIIPEGVGGVNEDGIKHYLTQLELMKSNGIVPFVTLYNWDLPQIIEEEGGWRNRSTVDAFANYADTCFLYFGKYVKFWVTLNDPFSSAWLGHGDGSHAPGRCSNRTKCERGDSRTEPYVVAHHLLLAHAQAVQIYRTKYQSTQNGRIGISLSGEWYYPWSPSPDDVSAATRRLEFQLGWFADPIFLGDYPASMKVINNVPSFSSTDRELVFGSTDFLGLNHFTSLFARKMVRDGLPGWDNDSGVTTTYLSSSNQPIGEQAASSWLYVVPSGFYQILKWIQHRYNDPELYVTENGVSVPAESTKPLQDALNDTFRINYHAQYLDAMLDAILDGVKVRGYFARSLMDGFEWSDGYEVRFGLYYVDFKDDLTRHPKRSLEFLLTYSREHVDPGVPMDSEIWYLAFFLLPLLAPLLTVLICHCREGKKDLDEYDPI